LQRNHAVQYVSPPEWGWKRLRDDIHRDVLEHGVRPRKLLLHRQEIIRIASKVAERGYTLVPTRMYFRGSRVKIEIALAHGKKIFIGPRTIVTPSARELAAPGEILVRAQR